MNAPKTKHKEEWPQKETGSPSSGDAAAPTEPADVETDDTGPGAAEPPSLEEQLAAVRAERDANYDRLMRSQAELENYRKRVQKEMEQMRLYQASPLVRDLLPGLDNLQRALSAAESTRNVDELVEGVRMVTRQFEDILAGHSAVPIEAVGRPFDPNLHEAVGQFPSSDHPPMTVLEEIEGGYLLHDRVVRPSKVIVSSGPPAQPEESAEQGGEGE